MGEYRQNRQFEAMQTVKELYDNAESDTAKMEILQQCFSEWPVGEGFDGTMVAYCYNRQYEAYQRLQ